MITLLLKVLCLFRGTAAPNDTRSRRFVHSLPLPQYLGVLSELASAIPFSFFWSASSSYITSIISSHDDFLFGSPLASTNLLFHGGCLSRLIVFPLHPSHQTNTHPYLRIPYQRTSVEQSVLNDLWVSVPVGSEGGGSDVAFKHMRKNQHEDLLFKASKADSSTA